MPDIVITLPRHIKWEDYQRELDAVKDRSGILNFKLPSRPNVKRGDRCYLCYKNQILGWQEIVGLGKGGFECQTTDKYWPPGWYVQRTGIFHPIPPIKHRGFRGFKYVDQVPELQKGAVK